MVNHEILGGLRSALERGESMKRAMLTLFNAGYKREEIEEAAKVVASMPIEPKKEMLPSPSSPAEKTNSKTKPEKNIPPTKVKTSFFGKIKEPKPLKQIQKPIEQTQITMPVSSGTSGVQGQQPVFQPIQIVSSYGEEKPIDRAIIFVLIFLLIFLTGLLATIFIFKQELINLFSSMFAGS